MAERIAVLAVLVIVAWLLGWIALDAIDRELDTQERVAAAQITNRLEDQAFTLEQR